MGVELACRFCDNRIRTKTAPDGQGLRTTLHSLVYLSGPEDLGAAVFCVYCELSYRQGVIPAPVPLAQAAEVFKPGTIGVVMTHVIFDECIRDGACVEVCPVECIIPGEPEEEWPWFYIDPETCIDCGACVPECPVDAILPEEDLPEDQQYCTELNEMYFTEGPGYAALDM